MNPRERSAPSDQDSKQPAARVALTVVTFAVLLITTCLVSGRWTYHLVPDTASYLQYSFSPASASAKEIRTPVYPVVLRLFQWISPNQSVALQLVALNQILLHAVASAAFFIELRNWQITPRISLAIAATVAVGCTFWDNVSTIATDCPAMSLGVLCSVLVLSGWRRSFSTYRIAMLGACIVLAVGLRPAYLFLIPWAGASALVRPSNAIPTLLPRRLRDAALIVAIPVVTVLGWCVFRYSTAGDFSILPFGHQNMAAVTTQLLDNDELKSIPGRVGELASEIADLRVAVSQGKAASDETLPPGTRLPSADGLDLRTSRDPALRAESFMALENRWDAMTYLVV
ncbi:signal peptide protein, partial [Rhodopirellula sallentina SM41]